MSYGKITTLISLLTFIAAVFFLVTKGLNYSVEFTGGTVIEVQYAKEGADPNQVRTRLNELKMGEAQVQSLGTNKQLMIRLPNRQDMTSAQLSNNVLELLRKEDVSDLPVNRRFAARAQDFVGAGEVLAADKAVACQRRGVDGGEDVVLVGVDEAAH